MMNRSFLLALSFLTRIPVPKNQDFEGVTLAGSAWAFPLVGLIVGLLSAGFYLSVLKLGVSHGIAAWLTVGFTILLTGGLHEDGLADMADGLAHGRDKEQKLAIMRDSRIGSYGVLALIVTLAIRANAMAAFSETGVLIPIIAAAMCSRACMVILMFRLPSARTDGLAATAGKPSYMVTKIAFVLAIIPLIFITLQLMAFSIIAMIVVCYLVGRIASKHFGGITGDVLGATQQISETLLLVLLAH